MRQVILDFSANTHKNNKDIIDKAILSIKSIDTRKHEIIFKTQLFKKAGNNIVCNRESFDYLYKKCKENGYKCTASVFDKESLDFLLSYDVPFVKIANNRDLDHFISFIPRGIPVYISLDCVLHDNYTNVLLNKIDESFRCISKYPAQEEDYSVSCGCNLSDHTIGTSLYKKCFPKIWEKHLKLEDSVGLDAGLFAITPEELKDIL